MGHLLMRGWILASLLMQTSIAMTLKVLAQSQAMHTQLFVVCSFFEGSNSYSINHRGTLVECSPLTHYLACKGIANSQFKTGTQSFSSSPPALELCIPAFTSAKPVFGFVQSNSELFTPCPQTIWNHIQRIPDCPPRSRTTLVTTVCPVTEAARATRTDSASPTATDTAVNNGHGSGGAELTTSTVFSTRTATITACPSSVTNCPLRSKTTYVTTETLVVSTTVCPVADITGSSGAIITTQTASHPSATVAVVDNWSSMGGYDITTSTILSTRVITVTACPSSVTNCPLRSKTTYASTETLVVATTVYPVPKVTNTKAKTPLPSVTRASEEGPSLTTSTILSTRIATVASCTGDDCRSSSSDSYVTTETLVVGTTVYTVYPEYVSVPTEGVDAMAAPTTAATLLQTANSAGSSPKVVSSGSQPTSASETSTQGTGSSAGSSAESSEGSDAGSAADSSAVSGAGSGAAADTTYTTTIIVESCSNDGTCTEYGSTITMAQTSNLAQPTVPPSPYSYTSYLGSGLGWNHSTPVSSAHVWPQSSHQAGMSTAMVTSTRSASAVNALYTGSASAGSQWSMLQVVGMAVAILTAVLV
ncbi:hypothetical protein M747DRAFT_281694 [Aspergillus niger ATCC 13496]|uniref:Uncharacterized protein n=1 Tax=Aspergillus niger ATCC 13496 TaxID=1353008 RepID=A0A370C179_ASPNG|nr:hypothetical protein M747DRAFT_281694 [Aspergillus niger ATCC 13496]